MKLIKNKKGKSMFEVLLGPSIVIAVGWMIVTGIVTWSSQMTWLALIGLGIWILLKRK